MTIQAKKFIKGFIIGNILMMAVLLKGGRSAFDNYTSNYSSSQLILGILLIELFIAGLTILLIREKKQARDEREELIDLKAHKLSYDVITVALVVFLITTEWINDSNLNSGHLSWILILHVWILTVARWHYRRKI